jgi:Zn-finger protein
MNLTTKKFIEQHIKKIIDEFDFENRKEKFPDECPCYTGKKCHNIHGLNCFLCFCPEYDNSKTEGGCKINSSKGKWLVNEKLPAGKIWDCSDCDYPHKKETAEKYLKNIFNI